ncbi:MAG: DUF2157 domain-containing protein [Capsulimonadales bacterium]|nr:DUF2157 domain-containing protein [Capsulimonadales bacterium]
MEEREITLEQRSWLEREIAEWRRRGVVTDETATRILELYVPAATVAERKGATLVYALMTIAALLTGVALLLLIGFNWAAIPNPVKLILLFAILGGVQGIGWHLRYRKNEPRLADVAFFLGCFIYGTNVWLVQQVFHVSAPATVGLLWWAAGVLPFVLILDRPVFHALLVGLLGLWSLYFAPFFGGGSGGFPWQHWLPPLIVLLPVALPGIWVGHRNERPDLIRFYVPLVVCWSVLPLWESDGWTLPPVLGLLGTVFLMVAEWPSLTEPMRTPYRRYGGLLAGGVLLPLGYYGWHTAFSGTGGLRTGSPGTGMVILAVAASAVFLLVHEFRNGNRARWFRQDFLLRCSLAILFAAQTGLAFRQPPHATELALLLSLLSNAATLGLAVSLIRRGLLHDRGTPFGFGTAYLLLWICLRYFDLFGEVGGMLGAGLLFALCAGILFGVAFHWRNRKGVHHA